MILSNNLHKQLAQTFLEDDCQADNDVVVAEYCNLQEVE